MPKLVDLHQIGIIKGRSIQENIFAFKLGKEKVKMTNQNAIFLLIETQVVCKYKARLMLWLSWWRGALFEWESSLFYRFAK